jgi:L-amino acid N-acyltransferase YncA
VSGGPQVRAAGVADTEAISRIHAQGIAERVATFETSPPAAAELQAQIASGALMLVAVDGEAVVGFAKVGPYSDRADYYSGVGEATIYVARSARRRGVGRMLLEALADEAERRGQWKLVAKVFDSNRASLELMGACGWREVGVHRRHGRLDGEWKDVTVVERLLGEAAS